MQNFGRASAYTLQKLRFPSLFRVVDDSYLVVNEHGSKNFD